jgi:hypothetical protein
LLCIERKQEFCLQIEKAARLGILALALSHCTIYIAPQQKQRADAMGKPHSFPE